MSMKQLRFRTTEKMYIHNILYLLQFTDLQSKPRATGLVPIIALMINKALCIIKESTAVYSSVSDVEPTRKFSLPHEYEAPEVGITLC